MKQSKKLNCLKSDIQLLMDESITRNKNIHNEFELDAHSLYLKYEKNIESHLLSSNNSIDDQLNEFRQLYNKFLELNSLCVDYHNKNVQLSAQISLMEKL